MEPQHLPVAANCSINFSRLFGNDIGSASADVIRSRVRFSMSTFIISLALFGISSIYFSPGEC